MSIVEKYLACINQCEREMSPDGSPCIYRGEPECYPKVSSTLYRYYEEYIGASWKEDLGECERSKILKKNDSLVGQTLGKHFAEIQHLGGKTNWIDFTRCPLVALFFACFGENGAGCKVGRIIVARESLFDKGDIVEPKCERYINPRQRSVLVRSNSGVIGVDGANVRKIKVPLDPQGKTPIDVHKERLNILMELEKDKEKDISILSIYSGILGHVRQQKWYLAPLDILLAGMGDKNRLEGEKSEYRSGYQWGLWLDGNRYKEAERVANDRYKVVDPKHGHVLVTGSAEKCAEWLQSKQKP